MIAIDRKHVEKLEMHALVEQVFTHYEQAFQINKNAKSFVRQSPRIPDALKSTESIGMCERTLGRHIPKSNTVSGGTTRGLLKRIGLFTATGGEFFRGCIVFPNRNSEGQIISATGIRYGKRIRRYEKTRIEWQFRSVEQIRRVAIERAKEVYHV